MKKLSQSWRQATALHLPRVRSVPQLDFAKFLQVILKKSQKMDLVYH